MAKQPAGFSADLLAIQGEVEADVGTILKIAKQARGVHASHSIADQQAAPPPKQRRRVAAKRQRQRTLPASPPMVQNVTTRLSQRTNELLTEAALRQRLGKTTPATRQDIIEAAVCQWLRQHGYDHSSD